MALALMEGAEAIARGAMAAGCRFFAGYPITPATGIYNAMLEFLPPAGGICIQGEDEIASIGYCLGASMAGMKAMTATSGPGISLCSESISFAIAGEIPVVIVNVQRLGPSTGSPTKGADGDIQFLRWGSSGGLPVVVLAPSNVSDCHTLTVEAFNLAEVYRCPVFLAANKEIAMTRETVDLSGLKTPEIRNRKLADDQQEFWLFGASGNRLVPDFLPVGSKTPVRQTSSTHGPDGYITTDPEVIARAQVRRMKKLLDAVESFAFYEWLPAAGAKTLLICYGVTGRAARRAVEELCGENVPVSLLLLKTLWPVPERLIGDLCSKHERIVVVEMNLGQYVREVERLAPDKRVVFSGRMDGELIEPGEIKDALRKEALRHG